MLYNDGVVAIYDLLSGNSPDQQKLQKMSEHWYGERTVGVTRFYAAMKADCRIDMLLEIWENRGIRADQYAIPEDGKQYRIANVQHTVGDHGLRISLLTLERLGDLFESEGP